MKNLDSFAALAGELSKTLLARAEFDHVVLERGAKMIEARAKKKIGELQEQAGEFVAWSPLADSTIVAKEKSSSFDLNEDGNPLLVTGAMRESIEHTVIGNTAHIGSNSDIAVYQELGTEKIPPRSFLGGSAAELGPEIADAVGQIALISLEGKDVFNEKLLISGG